MAYRDAVAETIEATGMLLNLEMSNLIMVGIWVFERSIRMLDQA
jgi:hypothetical protein